MMIITIMMMIITNMMMTILTPAVEPLLCLAEAQTPREPVTTSVNPPGGEDDDDCHAHKYHYHDHHNHDHYHCDHMIMIQGAGEDQCEPTWWWW